MPPPVERNKYNYAVERQQPNQGNYGSLSVIDQRLEILTINDNINTFMKKT